MTKTAAHTADDCWHTISCAAVEPTPWACAGVLPFEISSTSNQTNLSIGESFATSPSAASTTLGKCAHSSLGGFVVLNDCVSLLSSYDSSTCDPTICDLSICDDFPHLSLSGAGYTFVKEIAQVGGGVIQLATHMKTGALRSLKCFEKPHVQPQALELMRSEAEILLGMGKHPNIGEAIGTFQDHDHYYLVQPYYSGGTLAGLKDRAVDAGVEPTENWWKQIFGQCLEGLAHMHAQSIMHCDIKEANIMLRSEDLHEPEVVIIDMGVAQRATTQRSIIYGTPGYIPPEVWEAKNWYPQSDSFSFGVVVIQMVTGKTGIFTENAKTYKDVKQATETRRPPFHLVPMELQSFRWLAHKLLVKDLQARFTATEILKDHFFPKLCGEI